MTAPIIQTTRDPVIAGGDADDVRSSAPGMWVLRRELGRLEDRAAATDWAWDAEVSRRVDCLLVLIERARA